jgi:hypothetical protein
MEATPAEPGIVGRSRELQQLDAWFQRAMDSSRQIVFISGEAGLGKTTLVDTWMRSVQNKAALARGQCQQQFGSGEPYLPVFEALEQLSRTLGQRLVEHLRSRAPTWLMHMPALISLEDRAKLRDEVFGSTRERMLREITDALDALSGEAPLVLALEDLHWSDPSTVDLLSSIARRTSPARLMVLATYRPSAAGGSAGPLRGAQNELELHRQCKVLPLDFLSESATVEYLAARYPHMDCGPLAAALHRRTNGNPLYVVSLVEELERSGRIGSDPAAVGDLVPETLQQMFERQASQLSEPYQEMLDVAAAAGELFSVAAIAAASGRDTADIESHCEDLVRRHMILKRGDLVRFPDGAESPGYRFVHALCRDALYRRIPAGRRARLHGQLGQAREQLHAADPQRMAGLLAGHFEAAGDFSKAIWYFRLAAEGAAGHCSPQEAAQYLERGFAIVERLPEADRASSRMDLLEQRGSMRLTASDMTGAIADFSALAEQAGQSGALDRQTRALLQISVPLSFSNFRQALKLIEQARSAQSALTDSDVTAVTDVYLAFLRMYLFGWSQEDADLFHAALPKLRVSPDLRLRSRLASMEAAVLAFVGDNAAACERAEESRRFARRAGVFFDYFVATMFLNWALLHRGDLGQALRVARDGAALAERNGSTVIRMWFTVRENWVHLEAFDTATALLTYEGFLTDPAAIASRPMTYPQLLWLGLARLANHDYAGAWQAFEELRVVIETIGMPFQVVCPLTLGRAECELERGNYAEAEALAARLLETAAQHRELNYLSRAYLLFAEIASRKADFHSAAEYLARSQSALEQCEAWTVEWRVQALGAHVFARLGRLADAEASRERSLSAAERVSGTLAGEPALQQSFMTRVHQYLAEARSSSA